MPRDPYAEIRPGERTSGIASAPWNRMLRGFKAKAGAPMGGHGDTSVEIQVKNATANPVGRFGVLQIAAPTFTYANDPNQFFSMDVMDGTTPAAGSAFAITLQPLSVGDIGPARLLGLARCKVTINATTDSYADCTTATDKLSSGPTGPARILWDEDNFAATGDKWAVVELIGAGAGSGPTAYARFTLPGALATTDASKAGCTVDDYFGGGNPGSTITVYNLPASTNYIFSGASGHKGLAVYDGRNRKWWITQLECP